MLSDCGISSLIFSFKAFVLSLFDSHFFFLLHLVPRENCASWMAFPPATYTWVLVEPR